MSCISRCFRIEGVCSQSDVEAFEHLGFICRKTRRSHPYIRMVNRTATCLTAATMISLGLRGASFHAYSSQWLGQVPGLVVAHGGRCVCVPADRQRRMPITIVRQDGVLPTKDAALQYWELLDSMNEHSEKAGPELAESLPIL